MAIAYSINYNSDSMNIGYPSEPILAIAVRDYLKSIENFSFKDLLQDLCEFVQMRPVDKGEITENIFSFIVLLAIDKSPNIALKTDYDMDVSENDDYLKKIFSSYSYLLENFESKFEPTNDVDMEGERKESTSLGNYYHVTTVENFLKLLFGDVKGKELSDLLGPNLRNGIVNATHVISTLKNFPYEKVYGKSEAASIKFREEDEATNGRDIIDQAMLRSLFIRQAMLKMPPRYPGLDMCIPLLMKRSLRDDDSQEGVFGYIGLQYKSSFKSASKVLASMDPCFHYVPCGKHSSCTEADCTIRTKESDLNLIYQNHLIIYLAATFNYDKIFERVQPERESKSAAIRNMTNIIESESDSIDIDIGKMYNEVPYIVTKSIKQLSRISEVLDDETCTWIQNVIHAQNDPFKHVREIQYRMVADNVLNMASLKYPEADSELRTARGFEPLADPFDNLDEWSNTGKIKLIFSSASNKKAVKYLPKI